MCRRSPKGIHLPSKLLTAFLRVEQFSSYLLAAWLLTHSLAFSQQNPAPLELPRAPLIHLDAAMLPMEESPTNKDATETKASPVQRWLDQSPQHWDFIALDPQQAPTLVRSPEGATVRFDGNDDALRMLCPLKTLASGSIWMVVAPHENPGDFRGLIATNAPGHRDYMSGFNMDLGPGPSLRWDMINIEGQGFSGARNLATLSSSFGTLSVLCILFDANAQEIILYVDGRESGRRPWNHREISIEEWTLGARFYTNGPGEQQIRGNTACDIAELIVFDGPLSATEQAALTEKLLTKHTPLRQSLIANFKTPRSGTLLVKHPDPPQVQMLVGGFEVHRLPVEITNVNNLAYRPDGALVTLGYNGDVQILRDTDGDELEDNTHVFYKNNGSLRGPIGMQFIPASDPRGWGVFVASKGKVSLLLDHNRDDQCDEEIIVAQGWEEITQNVDAVGLAMDREGALYFGLGAANYANAYLIDDAGSSKFDIKSDRGTIQKISPDFSRRETVCTGVRFPIGIAFYPNGDLFCTDQEGATWLANGNPFDELLHIEPNRHYGFPPRHPKHNPSVLDQPSVFDYGPQHQSTCGLLFNTATPSGTFFGPDLWESNAIVCGESRGKLWRTQLVKTNQGYVAQTQLIAALQELTVDSCISPQADLVVACHSGPPDWGTGPAGIGSLYKIRANKSPTPRPVLTWRESPNSINIAFDHPVDPTQWSDISQRIRIDAGTYVRAGDRYENLIPPYAVVQAQGVSPRGQLPVTSVGLSPDRRTVSVQFKSSDSYEPTSQDTIAVTVPNASPKKGSSFGSLKTIIEQRQEIEVDAQPYGVLAHWDQESLKSESNDSSPRDEGDWIGWIPHLDLAVSKELTKGSAEHDRFWKSLKGKGVLTLSTQLDARDIYRPKIQPGAKIDYLWPEEHVQYTLSASGALLSNYKELRTIKNSNHQSSNPSFQVRKGTEDQYRLDPENGTGPIVQMKWSITKSHGDIQTTVFLSTQENDAPRAMPLNRFFLPWVQSQEDGSLTDALQSNLSQLEGGNWGAGRKLFFSDTLGCAKCHAEPGTGIPPVIGPDLSNLPSRDYSSNLRDIQYPSHAINPEFIGHQLRLKDGSVLTGVIRDRGSKILVGDTHGRTTELEKEEIEQMLPSKLSVMPDGLLEKLDQNQIKDLLTYLMKPAPSMPLSGPISAPTMRTFQEVAKVLEGSDTTISPTRSLNIVLVAGPKDHGPSEHDYPAWLLQWGQLLTAADDLTVDSAWEFPNEEQLAKADVLMFFQKGSWDDLRQKQMDSYFARGGGAIYLHWAVNGSDQVAGFSKRIGLASWGGKIKYRHGPLLLKNEDPSHPIMRNVPTLDLLDESYWLLTGDVSQIGLLATSEEDGMQTPQLWTYEKQNGRVFVSIPGHYSWTFDDPIFRIVVLRAIAWVCHEPIDRFNPLVFLGARMRRD